MLGGVSEELSDRKTLGLIAFAFLAVILGPFPGLFVTERLRQLD
jgi:hypothetical protein